MNPLTNAKIVGENVDPRKYHESDAKRGQESFTMSGSEIKAFSDCPKEWISGIEKDSTNSTDFGNLVDCLALAPQKQFVENFAVTPETYPDKKTGEAKPWNFNADYCKKWRDEQGDRQVVKPDEFNDASSAISVLGESYLIPNIIAAAKRQVYISAEYYAEEISLPIPIKGLIDIVPAAPFTKSLIDFKTCRSVHPRAFKSHVHEYGYALSAALYLDLYNAATGEKRDDFRFIIQKNSAPWTTGLRLLNNEWLEYGRRQYVSALNEYALCLKENKWPSHEERAAARGEVVIDGFMEVGPEAYMLGGW